MKFKIFNKKFQLQLNVNNNLTKKCGDYYKYAIDRLVRYEKEKIKWFKKEISGDQTKNSDKVIYI